MVVYTVFMQKCLYSIQVEWSGDPMGLAASSAMAVGTADAAAMVVVAIVVEGAA